MTESAAVGYQTQPRGVQDYIDELPIWSDGIQLKSTPLSTVQWSVWWLATAGKFLEGMVVFMTGVAMPLVMKQFDLRPIDKGFLAAATLFGILIGALALGGLSDRFGRKKMFVFEMVILLVWLIFASLSWSFPVLVLSLVGIGLALGCDYPTAHTVISESIPSSVRGRLVLGAFSFQALGAIIGTGLGYAILTFYPQLDAWRLFYLIPIPVVALVIWGRVLLPESSHWLQMKGMTGLAENNLEKLLDRPGIKITKKGMASKEKGNYRVLFSGKYLRSTILASIPWFFQDLSTYGIGIFTPVILAKTLGEKSGGHTLAAVLHDDILAAKGTAMIDVLLFVGIIAAILLVDRVGRIPLQIGGFIGCAVGLFVASLSGSSSGDSAVVLLFAGFMTFNFMTNLGPNSMTYLIAGEVFPTRFRGSGAGFAASVGKVGAVIAAFLFPILHEELGTARILQILIVTSLMGSVVTWFSRIESKGTNLETV